MKLILIGAPGSGKRTQAKYLTEKYHVPLISTGGLLRAAVAAQTPLGRQAKTIVDAGQLVPNDLVIGMIRERIARPDAFRLHPLYHLAVDPVGDRGALIRHERAAPTQRLRHGRRAAHHVRRVSQDDPFQQ